MSTQTGTQTWVSSHRLRSPFNRVVSPILTDPQNPKFWLSTESVRRKAVWALLIAGLIFLASSRSRVAAPHLIFLPVDKVGHFCVYGLLATLLCRIGSGWRAAVWALVAASVYGVSDEFHQSFVPGRGVEFADWVADTAGAVLAVALYRGWAGYRKLLETPLARRRQPAVDATSAGK